MTVLVDWQIEKLCLEQNFLDPYDPEMLNPASIDVRVGHTAKLDWYTGWQDIDLTQYSKDNPYLLRPKHFILVGTLETFNVPVDICGEFRLKSSRAREAWNQCLAVWLDPKWTGSKLTLELINESNYRSLPLYPGLRIGQIILHSCEVPRKHYGVTGRYNQDLTVMGSKG